MPKPTDIELSVGLNPKDVKDSARELGKSIEDIFNKSAGDKLDSKMQKLQQQMSTTTSKAQGLIDKMTKLESKKIPTEQYTELSKELGKLEGKYQKLGTESAKLQRGPQTAKTTARLQEIEAEADKTSEKIYRLNKQIQALELGGKAYTTGADTTEYNNLSNQLANVNNQSRILINNWDNMVNSEDQVSRSTNRVANSSRLLSSVWTNMLGTLRKIGSAIKNFVSHLWQMVTAFKLGSRSHKGFDLNLKKGLMTILKYGFGIRSLYFGFRKLRSAVADGIKSVVLWEGANGKLNKSISSMQSALSTLKNNIGASFVPLINSLAPAITNIINLISEAIQKISMFIAALTGQKTFLVANKVQENFAAGLDKTGKSAKKAAKELKGYLSPLDEINKFEKKDDDKDSGSGAGGGATFKEVPIDSKIFDLINKLKEMWDKGDFYDLGKWIGTKLRDALESIPWDKIRETSNKLGKSVASLINGFVEVERLAFDIGYTVAQGVNTVFEFINGFVHELHWDSIGKFIADLFNGFFETIDWDLIKDTVYTGLEGLADSINSFVKNFHWSNISTFVSNAINTLATGIYKFVKRLDWKKLGTEIGNQLEETIKKIDWRQVGRTIGAIIQSAIDFCKSVLKGLNWATIKKAISDLLKGFFEEVNKEDLAKTISAILLIVIGKAVATTIISAGIKSLGSTLLGSLFGTSAVAGATSVASSAGLTLGAGLAGGIVTGLALAEPLKDFLFDLSVKLGKNKENVDNVKAAYDGWGGTCELIKEGLQEVWYKITGNEEGLARLNDKVLTVKNSMGETTQTVDRYGNTIIDFTQGIDDITKSTEAHMKVYEDARTNMDDYTKAMEDNASRIIDISVGVDEYGKQITNVSETIIPKLGEKTYEAASAEESLQKALEDHRKKLQEIADHQTIYKTTLDVIREAQKKNVKEVDATGEAYKVVKDEAGNVNIILQDSKPAYEKAGDAAKKAADEGLKPYESASGDIIEIVPQVNSSLQDMQKGFEDTSAKAKQEGDKMVAGMFGEPTAFAQASDKFWFGLWDELKKGWEKNKKEAEKNGQEIIDGTCGPFGEPTNFAKASDEFFLTLWECIKDVFGISSPAKNMKPLGENILFGVLEGFTSKFDEFTKAINNFYNNTVKPWFDISKWKFEGVSQGLRDTFEQAKNLVRTPINTILGFVEKLINGVVDAFNTLGSKLSNFNFDIPDSLADKFDLPKEFKLSIPKLDHVTIPRLAQGGVIPPNKEFLAVLGDQKQGTNIETPLSTMMDAFRQVMRENNGGNNGKVVIQMVTPDKQKLAEYVVEGGKVLQMSTGNNIFELVGG